MNINLKQSLAILIAVLGVLMVSATNLTDLFGPGIAKVVVSAAGLLNSVLAASLAVITSQGSTVKEVLAMPGVENLDVNAKANPTLAALAIDPKLSNIAPAAGDAAAVKAIAEGSSS